MLGTVLAVAGLLCLYTANVRESHRDKQATHRLGLAYRTTIDHDGPLVAGCNAVVWSRLERPTWCPFLPRWSHRTYEIILRGTEVDDGVIPLLNEFPTVKKITFERTSVPLASLQSLKHAMPQVRIFTTTGRTTWVGGETSSPQHVEVQ